MVALFAACAIALSASADAATKAKKSHVAQRASSSVAAKRTAATSIHPGRSARARLHLRDVALAPIVIPVADPREVSHDAAAIAHEFNGWLDEVEQSGGVSGLAAAIVKDDHVLLERGVGFADWSTGEPVGTDTVFRLASLSKAFAAAMTGILVEDGRLHWNTKVADMLPAFTLSDIDGAQRLTVEDILSHRVGLPHNTYDRLLEQDEPYELLVDRLKEVPMACPVGACYGYQNIAFSMVGDVVYATTGDFYYHQVEKRIFHPLGMTTATYGRDALESSKSWARPHHHISNGWSPFVPSEAYYRVAPAAGVNASVHDIEQWLIAQMGGRPDVLSPALLDTLHKPLVETERELRVSPWRRGRLKDAQYALGWRIYDYAGETLIFHAGAVQGYRAMIAFLPKYRFGAVMLWNSESGLPAGLMPMLFDRYLGLPEVNWAGIDHNDTGDLSGSAD
jgi:beta-lactamase class C